MYIETTAFEDAALVFIAFDASDIVTASIYVNDEGGIVLPPIPFPED